MSFFFFHSFWVCYCFSFAYPFNHHQHSNIHFDVKKEMFFAFYNNFFFWFCLFAIQANHQHWHCLFSFSVWLWQKFRVNFLVGYMLCALYVVKTYRKTKYNLSLYHSVYLYRVFFFCLLLLSILLWHIVSTRFCV